MASQADQAAIQAASDTMVVFYTLIAAIALLVYDTCLTMTYEIDYIWNNKLKLGTVLYSLVRYPVILYISGVTIENFLNTSLQTCNGILRFTDSVNLLPIIGIQGLLLARTYAITEHKRVLLVVLGVLGGLAFILDLTGSILDKCDITSAQIHTLIILDYVSGISTILFDTVVVAVTLASTLGTWRVYRRSTWNRLTLTHLLAQQSLMRYGFVLTLTLSDLILRSALRSTISDILAYIQNRWIDIRHRNHRLIISSLSVIIICRFHLDLQRSHAHPNTNTSQGLPSISLGSFHAATRSLHDAVMAEFGDPDTDERIGTESFRDKAMPTNEDMPAGTMENHIVLVEVLSQPQDVETPLEA